MESIPRDDDGGREIYLEKAKRWIKVSEMQEIFSSVFASESISFYMRYKRCGLPFLGGWAEQPEKLIEIIDLLAPYDNLYHPPMV